ncbi:MAG TPA: hypothetical protein VLX91_17110 [Candidatus Acidoferrales bacterium]|nr:hypothetical protein [Candidatus Acidoferrales bacterium]
MAQLNKSPLGKVQGKLGDMAFRQRNGKNIIALRPKKPYTPAADQGSIDRRSRFAFSAKLAQSIYSVPELAALWLPVTPSGMSAYNYIIQKNITLVNPDAVTDLTAITPGLGFAANCTDAALSANAVSVALAALGRTTGIDISSEPNVKLAYVLSLVNPANKSLPDFWFVAGAAAAQPTVLDTPMTFSIPLFGQEAAGVGNYGDKRLLFALVTLDSANKPVKYSGTLQRVLTGT